MAGTELAKAYVQIVPSAEGIKGKLTNALSGEAGSAGDSAGKIAGGNLASKLKGVIAAAGIGTALKSALTEGADLQQSLGGIETLFKDSASKVIANAQNAYKTAGLSANEYMESVTSFSASLLQGLAGDTNKAADVADMALTDMSDNANKMGTSMEAIQNAYQGFAKQNYTMLDNLKLGYGGTKTEMERLLADASKLSGVKYDMSNLSDVYEAIHVIQEEMGITGTTAKEASATFSGSLSAMKSATKNLLGQLVLGEDIWPSLFALRDTVYTFVNNNLLPMAGEILKALPDIVEFTIQTAIQGINMIAGNADLIIQKGSELIGNLIIGIIGSLPYIAEAAINLVKHFGEALINTDWLALASGFIEGLSGAINLGLGECFGTSTDIWLEKGAPIFEAISNAISVVRDVFAERIPVIKQFVSSCFNDIRIFWENNLKPCLQAIGNFIANVLAPTFDAVFKTVIGPIVDITFRFIKEMWENTLKPVFTGITDFLTGVFTLNFEQAWNGIKSILKGILNGIITCIEGFVNGSITALNGLIEGINVLVGKAGSLLGFNVTIPTIGMISLPKLEQGGILKKGQMGFLEGSGAEAVVPLDQNHKWITRVAQDMNAATGDNEVLKSILAVLVEMKDALPDEMADKLSQMKFAVDKREFARLVKAVS
jgi:hypothetical protein